MITSTIGLHYKSITTEAYKGVVGIVCKASDDFGLVIGVGLGPDSRFLERKVPLDFLQPHNMCVKVTYRLRHTCYVVSPVLAHAAVDIIASDTKVLHIMRKSLKGRFVDENAWEKYCWASTGSRRN